MFEPSGEAKLFYKILELDLDQNFERSVNSYAAIRKEQSHLGTQIHFVGTSMEFEQLQLDQMRRLMEKLESLEKARNRLKVTSKSHKKFLIYEEKIVKIARRVRAMRAYNRDILEQERLTRRLNNHPEPHYIHWFDAHLSPSAECELLATLVEQMKEAKAMATQRTSQLDIDAAEIKKSIQDKIKRQYKRLAFKYHPDRYQGDNRSDGYIEAVQTFQRLSQAFQILSDDAKRDRYNSSPTHEVYLSLHPADLDLEAAVASSTKPLTRRQQQQQQQQQAQLRIQYALPERCSKPVLNARRKGKGWIINVDWTSRKALNQEVSHFSCELKVDDGEFDLVYGGVKPFFDFIARKDGIYTFRSRICNIRGEGEPSEEVSVLLQGGEVLDPHDAAGVSRASSKASFNRIQALKKRRALKKKGKGEENEPASRKQPKDDPKVRQLHKLIESPHSTPETLQNFLTQNGFELLGKHTHAQARGKGGQNALICAIRAERADLALVLLKRQYLQYYDANSVDFTFGRSPLIWAILMHQSEIAFAILQLKSLSVDVGRADADGNTALYWALSLRCSYALVHALVKRGADVNQVLVDERGRSTFLLNELVSANDAESSKQLIGEFHAHPDPLDMMEELYDLEITTAIDEIEMAGAPQLEPLQLERNVDETDKTDTKDGFESSIAESSDDEDGATEQESGSENEEEEEDLPDAPLLFCLYQQVATSFDIFKLLADRWLLDTCSNCTRIQKLSIMAHFAVVFNKLDELKWIVNQRNYPVDHCDHKGRTVLHSALALDSDNAILAFLMQECHCSDQIKDNLGFNALEIGNLVEQHRVSAPQPATEAHSRSEGVAAWETVTDDVSARLLASMENEASESSAQEDSTESALLSLPTEILLLVLNNLWAKEICKFQRTSKLSLALGRLDVLWRDQMLKVFGGTIRKHISKVKSTWLNAFRDKIGTTIHCNLCKSPHDLRTCNCGSVSYCSIRCRDLDLIWHGRSCAQFQKDTRWAKLLFRNT